MITSTLLFIILYTVRSEGFKIHQSQILNNSCVCVPSNLCADNDVTVNGEGLLDIRFKDDECENYFEVCCENPSREPEIVPQLPVFKGCGYGNPIGISSRITSNSKHAEFGELPWTALIFLRNHGQRNNMYKCGGGLIHPQVVITAAHCVFGNDQNELTVRVGEWNTKAVTEPIPHQDVGVAEIIVHPHYQSGSLKNDIGLLFLTSNVVLTDNVGLICVPPPHVQPEASTCIASGWGKDAFNKKGKHSSILKKIDLPLVNREMCVDALRKTRLGMFYNLHRSFICAGGEENKDTCKGDGGSPLICPIGGEGARYFLMGIVSWGIGCGENETPGVYVNVPLFVRWIDKQIDARGLDTSLYKY